MVAAEDEDMMVGPCSRSRRLASCNIRSAALSPSRRVAKPGVISWGVRVAKPGVISWGVRVTKPGVISRGGGLDGVTVAAMVDRAEIPSRPVDEDGDRCCAWWWWDSVNEARGYGVMAPIGDLGDTVDKSGGGE